MGYLIGAAVFAAAAGYFTAKWALGELAARERRRKLRAAAGLPMGTPLPSSGMGIVFRIRERRERKKVCLEIERNVPQMIDAIALGMRAGLSFESSLRLYAFRFDDELALACRRACLEWESGLVGRDEALRSIAEDYGIASLSRFISNVLRALKFGSPMGRMLETLADESRSCYRAKMEEIVAKAPVKMLMPTAALILPAMLILMMGPIALELLG